MYITEIYKIYVQQFLFSNVCFEQFYLHMVYTVRFLSTKESLQRNLFDFFLDLFSLVEINIQLKLLLFIIEMDILPHK